MAITINGSANTVAGLAAGGLPDNTVDGGNLAMGSDAAGDILYYNGTDYIRLAKGTDGQVLKLASGVPTWADDNSVTVADQWRVTSNFDSGNTDPVSANWERVDHASQGTIGTAMSESSGIWTFPVTGIYQVTFHTQWRQAGNTEVRYSDTQILGTTNNSSYDAIAVSTQGQGHGGTGQNYVHNSAMSLVDVTDTSNVKVKFKVTAQAAVTWIGHTQNNSIYATFIRLGDT